MTTKRKLIEVEQNLFNKTQNLADFETGRKNSFNGWIVQTFLKLVRKHEKAHGELPTTTKPSNAGRPLRE